MELKKHELYYSDNGIVTEEQHPVRITNEGNIQDQITGEYGSVNIPEITVYPEEIKKKK